MLLKVGSSFRVTGMPFSHENRDVSYCSGKELVAQTLAVASTIAWAACLIKDYLIVMLISF